VLALCYLQKLNKLILHHGVADDFLDLAFAERLASLLNLEASTFYFNSDISILQ
jgi:hypothetical protein